MRRLYTSQRRAGADPVTTLLIDDRWRWGALLFPTLWALWSRHWLLALGVLAAALALGGLGAAGYGALAALGDLAVRLIVAFEGAGLARLDRRLRGWREEGAVLAWDAEDAEARWFGARRAADAAPRLAQAPRRVEPVIEHVIRGPWGGGGATPA